MKKTLDYFMIEGTLGGNQEWFKNVVMYIGGCAAATACDCCIYLADAGERGLSFEELPGTESCGAAEAFIRRHIDSGYPVPYLMLRHKKAYYKDFVWHWFLCYGYEESEAGFWITVATYGESSTFLLSDLWDTGYDEKGGLIGIGCADYAALTSKNDY